MTQTKTLLRFDEKSNIQQKLISKIETKSILKIQPLLKSIKRNTETYFLLEEIEVFKKFLLTEVEFKSHLYTPYNVLHSRYCSFVEKNTLGGIPVGDKRFWPLLKMTLAELQKQGKIDSETNKIRRVNKKKEVVYRGIGIL